MKQIVLLLFMVFAVSCTTGHNKIIKGKDITARHAMVVSAYPDASEIGASVMADGGNAIDAAVATEFALAVCFPGAGNIGGGGFMVIRMADGTVDALDYREKAPGLSGTDMFIDSNGIIIDGLSLDTHLAAGVPGTVDGLLTAHKKYGKLPLNRLIQPAIDLARNGFILTQREAASLNSMREVFLSRNSGKVAFVNDRLWSEGDTLRQPELALTLERIRDNGREGFYGGLTAEMIAKECSSGNGIITLNDLKDYRSEWRKPVVSQYRGYEIISMPPPSAGGIALSQMLKMIEPYEVKKSGFHSSEAMHVMIEAERRAFADRAEFLGDPDFVTVPVDQLLNSDYLRMRMSSFDPDTATASLNVNHGIMLKGESEETTHYSIVDQMGNAVSGTTTLNNTYGSAIVVKGAGFILNDEMDDFSSKPGEPNMFGLTGGVSNAIQPGKRMLSSMTPTVITRNESLFMVLGSPGGSTIITSVFQVIVNVIDFKMPVKEAVDAGRFHHQWLPDRVDYEENRFDSDILDTLTQMGHTMSPRHPIGRVDAILVSHDGLLNAGSDSRGDDVAAGF